MQQIPALLLAGARLKASEDCCYYFHSTAILQRLPSDKKNTASKATVKRRMAESLIQSGAEQSKSFSSAPATL